MALFGRFSSSLGSSNRPGLFQPGVCDASHKGGNTRQAYNPNNATLADTMVQDNWIHVLQSE